MAKDQRPPSPNENIFEKSVILVRVSMCIFKILLVKVACIKLLNRPFLNFRGFVAPCGFRELKIEYTIVNLDWIVYQIKFLSSLSETIQFDK